MVAKRVDTVQQPDHDKKMREAHMAVQRNPRLRRLGAWFVEGLGLRERVDPNGEVRKLMENCPDRRDFIKAIAAALVTTGVGTMVPRVAKADPASGTRKIAVIGAGLGGLETARVLMKQGYDVEVWEARGAPGGRWSSENFAITGHVVNRGGEFVDSNHVFMHSICAELGLLLHDRRTSLPPGGELDIWWVDHAVVPNSILETQFDARKHLLFDDFALVDGPPWQRYYELDALPLTTYVEQIFPDAQYHEMQEMILTAYEGEYGFSNAEQSALNLVYLIATALYFSMFGTSDEAWFIQGGSQQLPNAQANWIETQAPGTIRYGYEFIYYDYHNNTGMHEIRLRNVLTGVVETRFVDRVVNTIPTPVLRKGMETGAITIKGHPNGQMNKKVDQIFALAYGRNLKVAADCYTQNWVDGSWTLQGGDTFWHSSSGDPAGNPVVVHWSGGTRTDEALAFGAVDNPEGWWDHLRETTDVELLLPNLDLTGEYHCHNWMEDPYALGTYSGYRLNEFDNWGLIGLPVGGLYIGGEQASLEFYGWGEGALEVAYLQAMDIIESFGDTPNAELTEIVMFRIMGGQLENPNYGYDVDSIPPGQTAKDLFGSPHGRFKKWAELMVANATVANQSYAPMCP